MTDLLKPKPLELEDQDGVKRNFILSRFPAVQGREIIAAYPLSALPKIGDYRINEEMMLKLMSYVAVTVAEGKEMRLTTRELINNHCGDLEVLMKIEMAMLEYNCSFLRAGKALTSLEGLFQKALQSIFKTLMALSEQSSQAAKPLSTNSEPSTM